MASANQLKALLKSHSEGDDEQFYSTAIQLAAHEAMEVAIQRVLTGI